MISKLCQKLFSILIYFFPNKSKILADGDLYTFGAGSQGQLGHNDGKTSYSPRLVEYFANNNKKIQDVCCKGNHTVVLTSKTNIRK